MSLYGYLNPANFLRQLPLFALVFILFLILVTIYVFDRSISVILQLRMLGRMSSSDLALMKIRAESLRHRLASVRQVLQFAFYAFGCCLFLLLCMSVDRAGMRSNPSSWTFLREFAIDFSFAADVLLVFLFLHTVQWIVSISLYKIIRRTS